MHNSTFNGSIFGNVYTKVYSIWTVSGRCVTLYSAFDVTLIWIHIIVKASFRLFHNAAKIGILL